LIARVVEAIERDVRHLQVDPIPAPIDNFGGDRIRGFGSSAVDLRAFARLEPCRPIHAYRAQAWLEPRVPGAGVAGATAKSRFVVLKLLASSEDRPQDQMDIKNLLDVADSKDIERSRWIAGQIMQRGTNRGRDLVELLNQTTQGIGS
jgi:hypothetical protein